ncbi:uncharacterized protein At4g04775-like [Raphanus sativus]|uniref:Uncharacterized protein At4g04775-like n=1 Tax=Raphanus sativus TaxID=3726 RepID=A0A9W3CHK2_RAPSA|nr:uncharacterized protein At4g04775-like [Raphanus sativus]
MSSSSNPNSSYATAMSANSSRRRAERQRGFPTICRKCGEEAEIFTSKKLKNPERLFHGCPNSSEEDKNHLFKWTDESAVEEIHDIKSLFDEKIASHIFWKFKPPSNNTFKSENSSKGNLYHTRCPYISTNPAEIIPPKRH